MLRATKQWDMRCPRALVKMFPVRRGYYYKINRQQAQRICDILNRAYGITAKAVISGDKPDNGNNGTCHHRVGYSLIDVHTRGHIKTTFHEWYHHLDFSTRGKYNSDDRRGGDTSLAWIFADRLFDIFRKEH